MKKSMLNSATESSCHHSPFLYLAKHLYEVTKNVITNKMIAESRGGSSVSDWSSGMRQGGLTSKVIESGLSHPLRLKERKGVEGCGERGEGDSSTQRAFII